MLPFLCRRSGKDWGDVRESDAPEPGHSRSPNRSDNAAIKLGAAATNRT